MPDIRFSIEAEDRGSQAVSKIDREVDQLAGGLDTLGREMGDAERKADSLERGLSGLNVGTAALTAGFLAAFEGVKALVTGIGDAIEQSAEYHREIDFVSRAVGRARGEVDAFAKTFALYGVEVDAYSDAIRTFSDRLGDARFDQGSEIAEIFQAIGLNIDDDNVKFEDFLGLLNTLDRSSRQFVIESIIGGEGARILEAFEDAGFQGRLEAQIVLDDESRDAILEGSMDYKAASQQFDTAVEKLGTAYIPALIFAIETATGIAEGLKEVFGGLASFDFGDALERFFTGQVPAEHEPAFQGPTLEDAFQPQGPPVPEPAPPRRLQLEAEAQRSIDAPAAGAGAALAAFGAGGATTSAYLEGLKALQDQSAREQEAAPAAGAGAALAAFGAGGATTSAYLEGLKALQAENQRFEEAQQRERIAIEQQKLRESFEQLSALQHMSNTLDEYLPPLAANALDTAISGSFLAQAFQSTQGTPWSAIAAFGAQTVGLLAQIFDQGKKPPLAPEEDTAGIGDITTFGQGLPSAVVEENKELSDELERSRKLSERIHAIIGQDLQFAHVNLRDEARLVWREIQEHVEGSEEQLKVWDAYVRGESTEAWKAFEQAALAAWQSQLTAGEISANEMAHFQEALSGQFPDAWADFEAAAKKAWQTAIDEGRVSADELDELNTYFNDVFIGKTLPFLEQEAVKTWNTFNTKIDSVDTRLKLVNTWINNDIPGSLTSLKDTSNTEWDFIAQHIAGGVNALGEFDDILKENLPATLAAFTGLSETEWAKVVTNIGDVSAALVGEVGLAQALSVLTGISEREWAAIIGHIELVGNVLVGGDTSLVRMLDRDVVGALIAMSMAAEREFSGFSTALNIAGKRVAGDEDSLTAKINAFLKLLDTAELETNSFATALNALPNIERTITYRYQTIGAPPSGGGGGPGDPGIDQPIPPARREIRRHPERQEKDTSVGRLYRERSEIFWSDGSVSFTSWSEWKPLDRGAPSSEPLVPTPDPDIYDEEARLGDTGGTGSQRHRVRHTQRDRMQREQEAEQRLLRQGFAEGGTFVAERPSFFVAGEQGRELVQITPENAQRARGGGGGDVHVNINYYGKPNDEADFERQVERAVKRATSKGRAIVNSRGVQQSEVR